MRYITGFLAGAAISALLAAAPAKAAVHFHDVGLITLNPEGVGTITFSGNTGTGGFTDYIRFQLDFSGPGSVSYSSTNRAGGLIQNGQLDLFSCTANCFGVAAPAPTGVLLNGSPLFNGGSLAQYAFFGPDDYAPGNYFLRLSGLIPNGAAAVNYTGTITVAAAVPEAGTWAMMVIGFAGLAFASSRRRSAAPVAA